MTSTSTVAWFWSLPGIRVVARLGPTRVLRVLAVVYVIGFTIAVLLREPVDPLATGRDPMTYLAAGERLNAGRPLYALSPGDRQVPLSPPYWSVPLLAPPPIAVLWRPLALFGEAAALAWWLGGVAAIVAFVVWLLARGTAPVLLAAVILTPALALTALSGNASAYLIPLLAVAWLRRDRPWVVAGIVVAATAIKLTPALLLIWVVAARRWDALRRAVLLGAALLIVSLVGAGPDNHVAWLASVPGSAPMPLSIAAWTGLPTILVAGLSAGAAVVSVVLRGSRVRDNAAFGMSVLAAAAATPSFYFAALGSLVIAVVPFMRGGQHRAGERRAMDGSA